MILDAILRCPIRSVHNMTEIAPGLYQCGHCGYGPSVYGSWPFYAFHYLELTGNKIDGLCITYKEDPGIYVMSAISWEITESGSRDRWMQEELSGFVADPVELRGMPLPIVVVGKRKWDLEPNVPPLRKGMFDSPYGPKMLMLPEDGVPKLWPLTSGRSTSG